MYQTSNSFFATERSATLLTETLDATCDVNVTECSDLMTSFASQIRSHSNCGADYEAQNPLVLQAYTGFIAYPTLYRAGCLKSQDTGNYCFADAATNTSSPTSSYIYFLPLGVTLPSSTQPTCNGCVQDTMAIFAESATNVTQPVSGDYMAAAQLIDQTCGDGFVSKNVPVAAQAATSAAGGRVHMPIVLAAMASILSIMTTCI